MRFAGYQSKNIVSGTIEPNGSSTVGSTLVRVRYCKQCRRCVWRSCSTFTGSLITPYSNAHSAGWFSSKGYTTILHVPGSRFTSRDAPACPLKACNSRLRSISTLSHTCFEMVGNLASTIDPINAYIYLASRLAVTYKIWKPQS